MVKLNCRDIQHCAYSSCNSTKISTELYPQNWNWTMRFPEIHIPCYIVIDLKKKKKDRNTRSYKYILQNNAEQSNAAMGAPPKSFKLPWLQPKQLTMPSLWMHFCQLVLEISKWLSTLLSISVTVGVRRARWTVDLLARRHSSGAVNVAFNESMASNERGVCVFV